LLHLVAYSHPGRVTSHQGNSQPFKSCKGADRRHRHRDTQLVVFGLALMALTIPILKYIVRETAKRQGELLTPKSDC
jgi:hypothetical protein